MKYIVFMCRRIKILISNWPRTRYYRQGRQLLLTLLTMVTRWSRSMSNFFALIGQNLTGEFVPKIYAASWNLFTLKAEVLSTCDVFNCLFLLDVRNEIQLLSRVFCYSWLVCLLGFCLRNTSLVKVGNPILDGIDSFSFFTLLDWKVWSDTGLTW